MKNERRPVHPLAKNLGHAFVEGVLGDAYPTKKSIAARWKEQSGISQAHAFRILGGERVPSVAAYKSFLLAFKLTGEYHRRIGSYILMIAEDGAVSLNDRSPSPLAIENQTYAQRERRARENAEKNEFGLVQNIEHKIAS